MAYLSIDSKSIAIKNGQGNSGSTRFPQLMLKTSGIFKSCMRVFIIISSTRAGVTSDLSLYRTMWWIMEAKAIRRFQRGCKWESGAGGRVYSVVIQAVAR